MIRLGLMLLLGNTAGIAFAVLGYLCVRDGNEGFAIAFMAMAYTMISVVKGGYSTSPHRGENKSH